MRQWLSQKRIKSQFDESCWWYRPVASTTFLVLASMSWQASGQIAVRVSTQGIEPVYEDSKVLPLVPPTVIHSSGGIDFNIWYEDVIDDSGLGFDDPLEGALRQGTLNLVLDEVSATIPFGGVLDILVNASVFYQPFLAGAGTLFPVVDGFVDGTSLIRLRDGFKPAQGLEEIFVVVNFGFDWHTPFSGAIQPGQFDLSSVLLHEITHGLGFISLADSNGVSVFEPFGASTFTTYDSFLEMSDGTRLWSGARPSLQVPPSVLTSNSVFFGGQDAILFYQQGGVRPGIFAPSPYQPGSSISHWDTGKIIGGAVMEHAIAPEVIKDRYFLVDIGALRDIGYKLQEDLFHFVPGSELPRSEDELSGGVREIDLTISFYRPVLTPTQNTIYVKILGHFADAVFEATEGTHRIRTVTGVSSGQFASVADIVWGERGQPNSKIVGGRGVPGGHINMYDIFEMGSGTSDLNFLASDANIRKAGYVLAQQWMRYYLGIENEFAERPSDIPVVPSLMNDPFTAALTLDPKLLNLSVAGNGVEPFTDFEHTFATAQHRLQAVSAWSTIARTYTNQDPKSGHEVGRRFRLTYDELGPAAPSGTNTPRTDLAILTGSTISDLEMPVGISDPIFIAFDDTFRTASRTGASSGAAQTQSAESANRSVIGLDPQTFTFPIDDAATQLNVNVYFPAFLPGVNIFLNDPLGTPIQVASQDVTVILDVFGFLIPAFVEVVSFEITPPAPGLWSLTMSSRAGQIETFFEAETLTAEPPIMLSGASVFGQEGTMFVPQSSMSIPVTFLSYPEPFVVVANLNRGLSINGANVTGTLTRPNGFESDIVLRDNGIAPDLIANDGSYAAEISYFQNGTHRIRVSADNLFQTAALTYNGTSRSPAEPAVATPQPPDELIGEDFQRLLDIVVVVEDLQPDDHQDFFQTATPVLANNADEFGRIDFPGDIDFFSFIAPGSPGSTVALNVRASRLGNGISAKLTVFDIDGRTIIGTGRPSPMGYIFSEISLVSGFTYFASVEDNNPTLARGTYAFSVGPAIASDTGVFGIPSRAVGGGGGGGGGCLIATAAYGTPLASELGVLRDIRDRYLLRSAAGIAFVDAYYRLSPPIADSVALHAELGAVIRFLLVPILVLSKLISITPFWGLALTLGIILALFTLGMRRSATRSRRT